MNRRKFLKSLLAITAVAVLPIPKKLFGMNPPLRNGDDTALVQWHIDNGVPLEGGIYHLNGDIEARGKSVLHLKRGIFEFKGNGSMDGIMVEGKT